MKAQELITLSKQDFLKHLDDLCIEDLKETTSRLTLMDQCLDCKHSLNSEKEITDTVGDMVQQFIDAAPEHEEAIVDSAKAWAEKNGYLIDVE